MLEKKGQGGLYFLKPTNKSIYKVRVFGLYGQTKRTHSTHNHFVRWTRLTQTAFFPRMLWTWPLRPSSTTAFWKRKEKTAPKLRHGVLVKSLSLKAVFDKGRGGWAKNSSGKKAERLGVPATSRILTGDSQNLSFSTLTKVPFLIFWSDKPCQRKPSAHVACSRAGTWAVWAEV